MTTTMKVKTERHGSTALVLINRPEVRNCVDRETANALYDAFTEIDADAAISVAVLAGVGSTFCAGADLKALSVGKGNKVVEDIAQPGPMGPTRMRMSKPVIAAIEGFAVAGGLELALWCDLRIAATDATLGVYCRRFGVPLVDGGTIRLARIIGQGRALDLTLTGRGVGADEALHIGLVTRVVEQGHSLQASMELAEQLAAFPQLCLRSDRQSLLDQWSLTEEEALLHETRLGLGTIRAGETASGAQRFASGHGRRGSFTDF